MANIKSQIKRIKTNEKARLRNKSVRSSFKTAIRRFRDAVAAGDSKAIATELQSATRELDVAVSRALFMPTKLPTRSQQWQSQLTKLAFVNQANSHSLVGGR